MRVRQFILVAALVALPLAISANTPAKAVTTCTCTDILMTSGVCTKYGSCHVLEAFAPAGPPPQPLRSAKSCRRSQALYCDGDTCIITCNKPARQQQQQ